MTRESAYQLVLPVIEVPGGGRITNKAELHSSDQVTVQGYGGKPIILHRFSARAWNALVRAARSDGISPPLLLPLSGFRSFARQRQLWEEALKKHGSIEEARKWVAPPGHSTHQTGRSIDFYLGGKNSKENVPALRKLPAYQWLVRNASRFGFYPYEREPWHWEYNPSSTITLEMQNNSSSAPKIISVQDTARSLFTKSISDSAQRAILTLEAAFAILSGERNENKLTDMIFYSHYPQFQGQKISKNDPKVQEWLNIRQNLVRPALAKIQQQQFPQTRSSSYGAAISLRSAEPTIENVFKLTKLLGDLLNIPWRIAYTILQHEGGIKNIKHPDGVMQTTRVARDATIPHIPLKVKLMLLGKSESDLTAQDAQINAEVHKQFPSQLAIQIAVGIQELKENIRKFNGYVALAYVAYNGGAGRAYEIITKGASKRMPSKVDDKQWEQMCWNGAALLHKLPNEVRIAPAMWACDANIPAWYRLIQVYDKGSGIRLYSYQYLRSIKYSIHKSKPNYQCTWNVHKAKDPGSGDLISQYSRDGALDKFYSPQKLGAYYSVAKDNLTTVPEDAIPLKVQNNSLLKVRRDGTSLKI
jgi:LAS superfamily LD-carboxypeptidase LdcB